MRLNYALITLFILIIFSSNTFAQNFKGRITDKDGEPLPGSTVYIKNINQGLISNDEGFYQTTLAPDTYQIEYKCLGFKQINREIKISEGEIKEINITLEENLFNLGEVIVTAKEDPAYGIMRKAIEKAPLYSNTVKEYIAEAYIKGNAELLDVSSSLDKLAKKGEGIKLSEFKEQVFVQESFNEIHYTAPDKYKQTVKAFSSSIPDNLRSEDAMGLLNTSLYMPKVGTYISPLNPKSFSYYRFRYEGFLEEGEIIINKIRVEPKLKDPILFDGYIYIADNTWHIYSAELTTNTYGVKQKYNVTFQQLDDNVYLPITYLIQADIDIKILGMGLHAVSDYYASITYKDIKLNSEAKKEFEARNKPKKRSFEIVARDSLYTTTSDSLAQMRDSLYWSNIRTIPLDEREILTLSRKDSIQHRLDSARREHRDEKFSFGDILMGGQIGGDSAQWTFRYNGLLRGAIYDFNFVDGRWSGQSFELEKKIGKHNKLKISPYIYYASSRKRFLGGGDIDLSYAPMKRGRMNISTGSVSEDFNPNGISRYINYLSSIVTGKNYNYYYQKNYVSVKNNIELFNGFEFLSGIEVAHRKGLSNTTDYTWGSRKKIRPNILSDDKFNKVSYTVGFNYTPYTYYMIRDGAKYNIRRTSPTFYLRYNQFFSSVNDNNYQHYKLYGGISQSVKLSEYSNLSYQAEGGIFLHDKDFLHFADYQHFNTSNVLIGLKSPSTSFMLLDNYAASTNKHWLKGELNYNSQYILLKRLPFLQGKLFSESLHLKTLYTPEMKPYSEIGYSINIIGLFNFGTFASFKKAKYQDFGIRIMFDLESIK